HGCASLSSASPSPIDPRTSDRIQPLDLRSVLGLGFPNRGEGEGSKMKGGDGGWRTEGVGRRARMEEQEEGRRATEGGVKQINYNEASSRE
ncbi:unnamed protein product, partial [Musa textilis]